ncbi:MAG: (2Fe-2S)-binding protein [Elusimicrobiota bacterium]|nr:(2Fe-2S)-binding protein [Elusimicrobiota bacterium]
MRISFKINGKKVAVEAAPEARLLDVIREDLGLTGTKEGCSKGECGACSVIVDGKLVDSCLFPMLQAEGCAITTIEGVSEGGKLHPIQKAFIEEGAVQCGFCTPGMVLAAKVLLDKNKKPSEEEIKEALSGNLCRCTGYTKIKTAVKKAAKSAGRGQNKKR